MGERKLARVTRAPWNMKEIVDAMECKPVRLRRGAAERRPAHRTRARRNVHRSISPGRDGAYANQRNQEARERKLAHVVRMRRNVDEPTHHDEAEGKRTQLPSTWRAVNQPRSPGRDGNVNPCISQGRNEKNMQVSRGSGRSLIGPSHKCPTEQALAW